MSVTRRGDSWQAYIKVGEDRFRRSFSTREEAATWEALTRQSIKLGKPLPATTNGSAPSAFTIGEALDKTFEMHWRGSKSEEKQTFIVRELMNYFGKRLPVEKITTEAIDDFIISQKQANRSNATINRKLACLSKVLRFAHERGKLRHLPVFHRQKEGVNRTRWLTKEEEAAILNVMHDWAQPDLMDAFIVSIDTGIRYGELMAIESADVTADGLYIPKSKNDHPRLIPLTSRAREILERRKKLYSENLFPYPANWHRQVWDKIRTHLNLDDVVWHTLRHTTCSRLVQGGLPLNHVKEFMGHKAIVTTMRYAHLSPKHLTEALNILE